MMRSEYELRELLPWYVNGTLDASTRRDLEWHLARLPNLSAEVAWLRKLRSQIRNQLRMDLDQKSASTGLDTVLALIHGERAGKVLPLRSRIAAWADLSRRLPAVMAVAAAVLLAQAVILGSLLTEQDSGQIMPMSGGGEMNTPLLQLTFKPQATELQIRAALAKVQGQIVAGPGVLGVYVIRVPDNQGASALKQLRNDNLVIESVVLLQTR